MKHHVFLYHLHLYLNLLKKNNFVGKWNLEYEKGILILQGLRVAQAAVTERWP